MCRKTNIRRINSQVNTVITDDAYFQIAIILAFAYLFIFVVCKNSPTM